MIRLTAVIEYEEGRRQAIAYESDDAVVSIGRDEGVNLLYRRPWVGPWYVGQRP